MLSTQRLVLFWNSLFFIKYFSVAVFPFPSGNMAKNKQKGKKQKSVFQVANRHLKMKNKAKPVTTSLKKVRLYPSPLKLCTCIIHPLHISYIYPVQCSVYTCCFGVCCVWTDQCNEKWEGGKPKPDIYGGAEGCEEHFQRCCSANKETNTGRGRKCLML